ncbi:MAG TPA: nucleoside/nucleotide kinase family protein [Burkholderiaceae bacterium]
MTAPTIPARYLDRLAELCRSGSRRIVGLVGAPGAGKSTLASALQQALGDGVCQVVPMDGFHLANIELARLGLSDRKGAPETFDVHGYLALLRRLREQREDELVYAPAFRREIEEPIAGAIPVFPQTRLVITEGNYLLLNDGPWQQIAALLDEAWYVDIDPAVRMRRLLNRHESYGRSPEAAADWVGSVDEPNARLIEATRGRAQLVFRWDA